MYIYNRKRRPVVDTFSSGRLRPADFYLAVGLSALAAGPCIPTHMYIPCISICNMYMYAYVYMYTHYLLTVALTYIG